MIRTWRPLALISQRKSSPTNIFKALYCSSVPNSATSNEVKVKSNEIKVNEVLAKYATKKNITASWAVTILNDVVKSNPVDAREEVNQYVQTLEVKDNTDVLSRALQALSEPIPSDLGVPALVRSFFDRDKAS